LIDLAQAADGGTSALAAAESGPVVTGVLLLLVAMSILTWAIVGWRIWRARRLAAGDAAFLEVFYQSRKLSEIARAARAEPDSGPARLFLAVHQEIEGLRSHSGIAQLGLDGLTRQADRAIERATLQVRTDRERWLTFLASTASGGPFIGLFGTVWGIMNAFEGIGKMGSASLAVVAPGISEALIATATGLLAAIPAALAYNAFQRNLDEEEAMLAGFRLEVLNMYEAYVFPDILTPREARPGEH
jgi:biopolymer transport protein TolQ